MIAFDLLIDRLLSKEGHGKRFLSFFYLSKVSLAWGQVRDKYGGMINLYFDLFYAFI